MRTADGFGMMASISHNDGAGRDGDPNSGIRECRIRNDALRVSEASRYIHEHYGEDIGIALLSKVACMSPTKFKANFRKLYGVTVYSYIRKVRIDEAVKLFERRDLQVAYVAQAVGYLKPGAFAAAFKKQTGMLPSDCKKACGPRGQ
jgi:AraC-like DNA-binding protein